MNAQIAAFLWMLRCCEGTFDALGFHALFGDNPKGKRMTFVSFDDHPRLPFLETRDEFIADGHSQYTTAAGAFQITEQTWDAFQAWRTKNRLPRMRFNEDGQNACAIWLIDAAGALADVLAGRLETALQKCRGIWASLPTAVTVQHRQSMDFAVAAFVQAGGSLV